MSISRDEVYEKIVEIMMQVRPLDREEITDDARFFEELGGESIDFLEINLQFQEAFGVPIPIDEIANALTPLGIGATRKCIESSITHFETLFSINLGDRAKIPGFENNEGVTVNHHLRDQFTVPFFTDYVLRQLQSLDV